MPQPTGHSGAGAVTVGRTSDGIVASDMGALARPFLATAIGQSEDLGDLMVELGLSP